MDVKDRDRILKNIKYLKKLNGVSWDEIALSIGYEGGNAITNWFLKDRSIPSDDVLVKVANYFGITLKELKTENFDDSEDVVALSDELLFEDISENDLLEYSSFVLSTMFPIVESNDALSNKNFCNGYYAQQKLYEFNNGELWYNNSDINSIFSYYKRAIDDNVIEASVNQLSLLAFYWHLMIIQEIRFSKKPPDFVFKDFVLIAREMFTIMNDSEKVKKFNDFINRHNSYLTKLMEEVQKSTVYYEYAYYYLALRYNLGMMDHSLTGFDINQERDIGKQMMQYIAYMGNRFARNLLELYDIKYE